MRYFERPNWWLVGVISACLVIGIVGWIATRVYGSAASPVTSGASALLLVVGEVGFALVGASNARRAPRPWLVRLLSIAAFAWGLLMVAAMFTPVVKVPVIVVGSIVVLIAFICYSDIARSHERHGRG